MLLITEDNRSGPHEIPKLSRIAAPTNSDWMVNGVGDEGGYYGRNWRLEFLY